MAICETAPVPIKLSWSRLKNYEECHRRTKLLMDKNKSKAVDGRTFLPGTIADRAMRAWLENGKITGRWEPGGMLAYIEDLWNDHTGKDAEYAIKWRGNPRSDKKFVLENVTKALTRLEPILFEKVVPFPYMPEYRFTATMGIKDLRGQTVHIEVFGAVDVAVNHGDEGYGLYDLKITENDGYIRSTLAQLIFYAIAFRGWTGVWPKNFAFWAPLLDQPIIPLTLVEDDIRYMQSRIISYAHGIWSENWDLTADKSNCFNCITKHACPRWRSPIQQDEQGRNRMSFSRDPFEVEPVPQVENEAPHDFYQP